MAERNRTETSLEDSDATYDTSPQDWYMYMPECGTRIAYLAYKKEAPKSTCCGKKRCALKHVHTIRNRTLRQAYAIMQAML